MSSTGLHISISAETIFHIGPLAVTNSMITSVIVSALLLLFVFFVKISLSKEGKPNKLQNFAEWIVESLYNLVQGVTNDHKKTKRFLPVLLSFFLYILLNNWFGLVPIVGTVGVYQDVESGEEHVGLLDSKIAVAAPIAYASDEAPHTEESATDGESDTTATHVDETHDEPTKVFVPVLRPATADLNATLALAIISVAVTQYIGLSYLGLGYLSKFINFSSPIMFFVGILELISEFAKIISFAFRLFGNIFAGEVLLVVITFLLPLIAPMPFYGLEIFVGFIQSLVFVLLSLVFFNMATVGHEDH